MTKKTALILDFDGTIALCDVGDEIMDRFGPAGWRALDRELAEGKISLLEMQRRLWPLRRRRRRPALRRRGLAPRAPLHRVQRGARDVHVVRRSPAGALEKSPAGSLLHPHAADHVRLAADLGREGAVSLGRHGEA